MLLMRACAHRRAQDRHVQHAGQHDVVEEVALALDEAGVLVAADAVADAADLGRGGRRRVVDGGHGALPQLDASAVAASARRPGSP